MRKPKKLDALLITFESLEGVDEDLDVNKVSEAHHHGTLFSLSTEEYAPLSTNSSIDRKI